MEHFFSLNSGEDQKKRSLTRIEHFFPKFTLRCTPIQIIGGDADVDHSQTIGGDTAKVLGGYIPPSPPCFGTPASVQRFCPYCERTFSGVLKLFERWHTFIE